MKCLLLTLWAVVQSIPGARIIDQPLQKEMAREKVLICGARKVPITPCVLLRIHGYTCEKLGSGVFFISKNSEGEKETLDFPSSMGENIFQNQKRR